MDAAAAALPKLPALTDSALEVKGLAKTTSAVKEDTIVNRETKLALLIGFVAIVVVTVLVGEHFGKARNATVATTDLGTSTAAAPSATGLTVDPITATPVGTPSAPLVQPVGLVLGGANPAPGAAQPGAVQPSTPTSTPVVNADPNRFLPAAGVDSTGFSPTTLNPAIPGTSEIPGTRPVNTLGDSSTFVGGGRAVSTGVEKMHPVQRGETIAALALRYYGDKGLTKQLTAYNAKRLTASGMLKEGVTLRIPPRDVLLGDAVLSPSAAGRTDNGGFAEANRPSQTATRTPVRAAADKPKAATEKPKATGPRTYVIKKGDTLMTIAAKELGSAKRWESILVANPSVDENSLRAGMTIKIPATK